MDNTAGDLSHAAKELNANIEKQISHSSSNEGLSTNNVIGEKQEQDVHSSGSSSSEDLKPVEKLDSHIVKVDEVKQGDEAYAHLPPNEKEIVKRQLDIPDVKVTFMTLFRYATKNDIIIIIISCICAIAGGAVMPLMTVSSSPVYKSLLLIQYRLSLVNWLVSSKASSTEHRRMRTSIRNCRTSPCTSYTSP